MGMGKRGDNAVAVMVSGTPVPCAAGVVGA